MHDTTIDGVLGEAKRGGGYGYDYYSNNKNNPDTRTR